MANSAPSSALKKYIANHGDLPMEFLLGRMVLSTITDEQVKLSDVEKWMTQLGLDLAYAPAGNRALDAFKKATKDQEGARYELGDGRTARVMCRDVSETPMLLRRQISREILDAKGKAVGASTDKVLDCAFSKPTKPSDQSGARMILKMETGNFQPGEKKHVQAIAQGIHERFYRYYEFLDGQKLRATARDYLKGRLNALEVKGGVYFVQVGYDEELAGLASLVDRFGGDCSMTTIAVADLPRELEWLTGVLQRAARKELAEFTAEVNALVEGQKRVNVPTVDRQGERLAQMLKNLDEHMATLHVTKHVAPTAVKQAKSALAALKRKSTS